ncbi:putative DNA polymerase [Erysiphe neolycopersici]|uniref:DNA polymerase n=1 Tax=Erysiphe neolycopersici TaxID=212602 RepID=A0A420I837_9PEZI|nr:putative DNA polymerase [Erysiphe neolycopersici]
MTYSDDIPLFCMLDEQFGVYFTDSDNVKDLLFKRFETICDKLDFYMSKYDADQVTLIQVMYVINNSLPKLRLKNINKVYLDKNIINVTKTKRNFSENFLPLSTNEFFYGKPMRFDRDNCTSNFIINDIDFLDLVKKEYELNKDFSDIIDKTRFYHYVIKDKQYVIVVRDIDVNKSRKDVYNMHGFKILNNVIDEKLSNDSFIRQIANSKFFFEKGIVKKKIFPVKLPILKSKPSKYKGMANTNIGSFDIETYKDYDGNSKVYALGFTNLDKLKDNIVNIFYLGIDAVTPKELIIKLFVLHALRTVNTEKGFNYYIIDTKLRDSKLLKCVVRVKTSSGYSKITFIDSYNLLTDNLDNLSKSFGSKVIKGILPYTFITAETLNYVGNTPPIEYYKVKNKIITLSSYKKLYKKDWCLKTETKKYLIRDLFSLLEIIGHFNKYIFIEYNLQITECLTISRLALNIFFKRYLGQNLLPKINNVSVFSFIKQAYYGGVVEVYRPYGVNLIYYDVNSLYPFASKNPMAGHICEYIESNEPIELSGLFGFYYSKSPDNYLGLLPVHKKGLIMPNGDWFGYYFSEELKFAKENGYEIEVYKGYTFNKVYNVFDNYVDDLYEKKAKSKGSEKLINKFLLNSLIGRFGLSILKLNTEMLPMDQYKEILATKAVNSAIPISDNDWLVSYNNETSKKITTEHGLDYIKILNQKSSVDIENIHSFDDVAISISAAVTAYARIYMSKIKLEILEKGGEIYYSDTDSIVTNTELPMNLVGKELGKFKVEYKIKEAYFISSKTYCLVLEDEYVTDENKGVIIKSKGVFDNSLKLEDFKNMYLNNENVKAIKPDTKTNYSEGLYSSISKNFTNLNNETISKKEKKEIKDIIASVKDTEIFKKAFTHKSCNNKANSYETLEFLGDSILCYYVSKFLFTVYKNYDEGDMTNLRSIIVCTNNIAKLSKQIGLNNYLILNEKLPEQIRQNIINKDKTFADIFESFLATLLLEKGEDILVKFLLLTVFNNSKTKDKIEEFNKELKSNLRGVAIHSSACPDLARKNIEESRYIVIP